jgi:hypothetical protein
MPRSFTFGLLAISFTTGALVATWKPIQQAASRAAAYTLPPKSILVCGIRDHPCVTYAVRYHQGTAKYGDGPGEGFTDYQAKTIDIASSNDPVNNVQALEHEVYHAALWERGFQDTEKWDIHAWIYFSEGPFSMVLHDNPDLVRYIVNGY